MLRLLGHSELVSETLFPLFLKSEVMIMMLFISVFLIYNGLAMVESVDGNL